MKWSIFWRKYISSFETTNTKQRSLLMFYVSPVTVCVRVWMGVKTKRTFSHDLTCHFNIINHWPNAKLRRWMSRSASKRNTLTSRKPRSPTCTTIEGCKRTHKVQSKPKGHPHRLLFMPHLSINTARLHPTSTYKQQTTFSKTPHGICEKPPKMWSEN